MDEDDQKRGGRESREERRARRRADPSLTLGAKLQGDRGPRRAAPPDPTEGQPGIIERARGACSASPSATPSARPWNSAPEPPRSKDYHREMTGGGPFGLEPGQWTDDTAYESCPGKKPHPAKRFRPSRRHDPLRCLVPQGRVFVHGVLLRHRGDDAPSPGAFRADRRSLRGLDGRRTRPGTAR